MKWRIGCIHDLRDTFITGVKGKLSIDVLKRIAGHSDIATTIKFYATATERDAAEVRAAVSASGLAGGPGPFAGPFEVSGPLGDQPMDQKPRSRYYKAAKSA